MENSRDNLKIGDYPVEDMDLLLRALKAEKQATEKISDITSAPFHLAYLDEMIRQSRKGRIGLVAHSGGKIDLTKSIGLFMIGEPFLKSEDFGEKVGFSRWGTKMYINFLEYVNLLIMKSEVHSRIRRNLGLPSVTTRVVGVLVISTIIGLGALGYLAAIKLVDWLRVRSQSSAEFPSWEFMALVAITVFSVSYLGSLLFKTIRSLKNRFRHESPGPRRPPF